MPIKSSNVAKIEKPLIVSVNWGLGEPSSQKVMLIQGGHAFENL